MVAETSCAVVIVSYNSEGRLAAAIRPWLDAGVAGHDVVVVDNASHDRSAATAEALGCRVLRNRRNNGFATAVNQGVAEVLQANSPDWLLIVNPDTEAEGGLQGFIERLSSIPPEIGGVLPRLRGAAGPRVNAQCYPDLQAAARWLWDPTALTSPRPPFASLERNYLIGSLLVMRSRTWLDVGGLDEHFFLYGEDADLSARLHSRGHRVIELDVPLSHHGNSPLIGLPRAQQQWMIEGIFRFNQKHSGRSEAALTLALIAVGCALRAAVATVQPERSAGAYLRLAGTAARRAIAAAVERRAEGPPRVMPA